MNDRGLKCPVIGEPFSGGCPVTSCVFNARHLHSAPASGNSGAPGCFIHLAAIITGNGALSEDRKLVALGSTVGRTRAGFDSGVNALQGMAQDFRKALDVQSYSQNQCQACGYLRPCLASTLCQERREAVDPLIRTGHCPLTRYQLWNAVKMGSDRFLASPLRKTLKNLLSVSDLEDATEPRRCKPT